jgi:hypothetical protein
MILLLTILGCFEKAPTEASLFRRTLTLRMRNHSFFISDYLNEESFNYLSNSMIDQIMYPVLNGLSDVFEPEDYPTVLGCRGSSALVIRKYTFFSNWDTWGVEEDQYGRIITQEEIDDFFELSTEESSATQEGDSVP